MKVTTFEFSLKPTLEPSSNWGDQPPSTSPLIRCAKKHLPGIERLGLDPDKVEIGVSTTGYSGKPVYEYHSYKSFCPSHHSRGRRASNPDERAEATTTAAAFVYLRSGDFKRDAGIALLEHKFVPKLEPRLGELFEVAFTRLAQGNANLFTALVKSIEATKLDGHIPVGYGPRLQIRTTEELALEHLEADISDYVLEQIMLRPRETRVRDSAIDGLGALYLALEDRGYVGQIAVLDDALMV